MKLIKSRADLKAVVNKKGVVQEPVKIQRGVALISVDYISSLKNIHADGKFSMEGLSMIQSLHNQEIASGVILSGLVNVSELGNFKMGRSSQIKDLNSLTAITENFRPASTGSITGLINLSLISANVMWPPGYILKDVNPETIKTLPDWLARRLNFL